jgi:hypothetical protein
MDEPICGFHDRIGHVCGKPAPHMWGSLRMCCGHFDDLVEAMFEIRDAVREREHQDFMKIYESRTHKSSLAKEANCPSILPIKGKKGEDT